MKKKTVKTILDLLMVAALPLLMAYSLIGETFHEITGTAILGLFILHHILNRKWLGAVFKGKYNARRIFMTALDLGLLVIMLAQPVSGILMSKHLFPFVRIPGVSASARAIHLVLAYWGFVLTSVHAGGHLTAPLKSVFRRNREAGVVITTVCLLLAAFGCYAFARRQFAEYMFMKSAFVFFDFDEPVLLFLLDTMSVMILFASASCALTALLTRRKNGKETPK